MQLVCDVGLVQIHHGGVLIETHAAVDRSRTTSRRFDEPGVGFDPLVPEARSR